jgi:hypothetical protein
LAVNAPANSPRNRYLDANLNLNFKSSSNVNFHFVLNIDVCYGGKTPNGVAPQVQLQVQCYQKALGIPARTQGPPESLWHTPYHGMASSSAVQEGQEADAAAESFAASAKLALLMQMLRDNRNGGTIDGQNAGAADGPSTSIDAENKPSQQGAVQSARAC